MIINKNRVLLDQGELYCCAYPMVISTVLGSCVAVCLHDPVRKIGGMNHFVMPLAPAGEGFSARFGDHAIAGLIDRMIEAGARHEDLQAKIFGGAVPPWIKSPSRFAVGNGNALVARRLLAEAGIDVLAERTGGANGIKLFFTSQNGEARVRRLVRPVSAFLQSADCRVAD